MCRELTQAQSNHNVRTLRQPVVDIRVANDVLAVDDAGLDGHSSTGLQRDARLVADRGLTAGHQDTYLVNERADVVKITR